MTCNIVCFYMRKRPHKNMKELKFIFSVWFFVFYYVSLSKDAHLFVKFCKCLFVSLAAHSLVNFIARLFVQFIICQLP